MISHASHHVYPGDVMEASINVGLLVIKFDGVDLFISHEHERFTALCEVFGLENAAPGDDTEDGDASGNEPERAMVHPTV